MHTRFIPTLAAGVLLTPAAIAQAPKPKDTQVAAHWIYDDVPAAFAKARESGKPILALFR